MRVALIGPKWNEMVNSYPSLGLAYLAAIAEQEGHEAAVFDMGLHPNKPLADEVADIVAFLETLSGPFPTQTMPRLPATPGDMLE